MMLSDFIDALSRKMEREGDMQVRIENWPNKHLRLPVIVSDVRGAKPRAERRVSRGGVPVCLISSE